MAEQALVEPPEEYYRTDLSVGEIIRRTRLHYGQSLRDVERNLRIRDNQLEAIENGQYDLLPGKVYAIGFVKAYSEYLGLDGVRMVELYKIQYANANRNPELNFPVGAKDSKLPSWWMVAGSVVAVVLFLASWALLHDRDDSDVNAIPPVAEVMPEENQPAAEVFGPQQPSQPVPVVEAEQGIKLNITQNSWVEIKDANGEILVSKVLEAGDQYLVPERPDLTMDLGNAGGVHMVVDGKPLTPFGKSGEIRRGIPLDTAKLQSEKQTEE